MELGGGTPPYSAAFSGLGTEWPFFTQCIHLMATGLAYITRYRNWPSNPDMPPAIESIETGETGSQRCWGPPDRMIFRQSVSAVGWVILGGEICKSHAAES